MTGSSAKPASKGIPEEERPLAVIAAFVGNAAITITKGVAAVLTGSGGLLAETAHSFADTVNQAVLYIGVRRSSRGPSARYPLGHGKERYFWALTVALMLFFGGGVFSLYESWNRMTHPQQVHDPIVGFIVLGVAAVFEGGSLAFAIREAAHAADEEGRDTLQFVRTMPDPVLRTVLFEDSAALLGLLVAALGLVASEVTGNLIYDALASGAIGLLLVGVAIALAADARGLIIGESPSEEVLAGLRAALRDDRHIEDVVELISVRIGVDRLLVLARVGLVDGLDADHVEQALRGARVRLKQREDVAEVYLEATPPAEGAES